jgi:hypothetical protein
MENLRHRFFPSKLTPLVFTEENIPMPTLCRHRAEKALEQYWGRPVNLKESTTLVTALMNPLASASHLFLMENIGMHMAEASNIYSEFAPMDCVCDQPSEDGVDSLAA